MRISEVARAAGCSVRAVRHYHASGALLRVRALVDAGITLADIRSDSSSLIDAALHRIDSQLADVRSGIRRLLGDRVLARMEIDALDLMGLTGDVGGAAPQPG